MRRELPAIPWTTPVRGYPPEREYPRLPDLRSDGAQDAIEYHDRGWFIHRVGSVADLLLGFVLPGCIVLPFIWVLGVQVMAWFDRLFDALVALF